MTRSEKIALLHTLTFAYVDYLPGAGFTERPLWVNARGYGYLSCDDPSDQCWEGNGIAPEKWKAIRQQLGEGKLQLKDLQETSLLQLLDLMYFDTFPDDEDPCKYLHDLLTLSENSPDRIYCMNTIGGWQFFACEKDFRSAYERNWCDYTWEELSDEVLAACVEQLINEGILKSD